MKFNFVYSIPTFFNFDISHVGFDSIPDASVDHTILADRKSPAETLNYILILHCLYKCIIHLVDAWSPNKSGPTSKPCNDIAFSIELRALIYGGAFFLLLLLIFVKSIQNSVVSVYDPVTRLQFTTYLHNGNPFNVLNGNYFNLHIEHCKTFKLHLISINSGITAWMNQTKLRNTNAHDEFK